MAMEQQHLRFAADKTMRRMDVRREESARTRGPGGTEAGLHVVLPRLGSGYVGSCSIIQRLQVSSHW